MKDYIISDTALSLKEIANRELILQKLNDFADKSQDQTILLEEIRYVAGLTGEAYLNKPFQLRKDNPTYKEPEVATLVPEGEPRYLWQPIVVDPHAETQLLQRLGIPAAYFHRCPADLQNGQMHWWLYVHNNKKVVLRWHEQYGVRGIVSTRYNTDLDDHKIFPYILDAEQKAWDTEKEGVNFTIVKAPTLTKAWILFRDSQVTYQDRQYTAGVCIINSEVGSSALYIKPCIVASNGHNYMDYSMEGTTSYVHTTQLVDSTKVSAALISARRVAEVGIYQLLNAGKIEIEKPRDEIRTIVASSDSLPAMLVTYIEDLYQEGVKTTRLKLVQDILDAIKDLPIYRKHLAEQAVGRYLDLFSDTEIRVASIMDELG